ncbi:MAG TPA: futalosine hydrolase [Vicinamibacterales bacterium]|nr:futalosine hydrolase [Vicinamibacterales bacterium]
MLLVAATDAEIAAIRPWLRKDIRVLVTGVGMVSMAARCARALAQQPYSLALNVGVCGSFDAAIPPGTVVHVVRDRIAELGAEDGEAFLTMSEIGLPADGEFVNEKPPDNAALRELRRVEGITVNTVHGREASIAAVVARCRPQVESMEGAAFMCACIDAGVPFAQIRAVSNVVERRNRGAWRLSSAIANLAQATGRILEQV